MIINDFRKKYHDLIIYIGYSYKEKIIKRNGLDKIYFFYQWNSKDLKTRSIISGVFDEPTYYIFFINKAWSLGDINRVFSDIIKYEVGSFDFWRNYKLGKLLNKHI